MSNLVEKFLYNRKEAALSLGVSIRSVDYIISRRTTSRLDGSARRSWSPAESLRRFMRAPTTPSRFVRWMKHATRPTRRATLPPIWEPVMSNLPRGIYEKVPGSKIYWIR